MQTVKLIEVCEFVRNGANIKQLANETRGFPITRIETIANDRFNRDRLGYANITDNSFSEYYLKNGDVLLSHINGAKFIGRSVMYEAKGDETIIHGMNLLCLRFKPSYNPKFFCYYAKSKAAKNYFDKHTKKAVNQASITSTDIKNMPIPDIEIEEQDRIVSILDTLFERVGLLENEIGLFDELIKSRFIEMFGDPTINPNGFDVMPISALFDVGSSKRVFESEWTDHGVPFYRAREIIKLSKDGYVDNELFITEEMYEKYKTKYGVPKAGDMMVTGVGTLGICYIVREHDKFYFKDGNTLWFKNKGLCNVRFIKEQYEMDYVMDQIKGNANISTVGTYTITNANETNVLVPPRPLQDVFVNFVMTVDSSKEMIKNEILKTQELIEKKMFDYFFEYEED